MAEISICIPVFNFLIEPLCLKLLKEIKTSSINAEIIVIDDASDAHTQNLNQHTATKYSLKYIQLRKNIGRSAIRNLFTHHAKADLLLFLDCDVMPRSESFVHDYLSAGWQKESVVCGGICYASHFEPATRLHWKYGSHREAVPGNKRSKNPYCHFLTGNVLIPKKILEEIPFDENLRRYGYEDTLYGIELERNKVTLKHVDLPAEHLRLDDPAAFITKTENALQNLFAIYQVEEYRLLLPKYVKLTRTHQILKRYKLTGLVYFTWKISGKKIRRKLINGNTNLRLLDLYKLLFFSMLEKKEITTPY